MGYLAKCVAERVGFLDSIDPPQNAICNHFGDSIVVAGLRIGLSTAPDAAAGKLLITAYSRKVTVAGYCRAGHVEPDRTYVGYNRAIHHARANSIATALSSQIIDFWNGENGHNGISIVLDRPCSAILLTGIQSYRRLASPFRLTDADKAGFDSYRAALSR